MKTLSVRELQQSVKDTVDASQKDHVVVTRHGKPVAILVGVEGKDWETVYWETNRPLWRTIKKRRGEETISLAEMQRRLGLK
jgi:prevent-host-death family protein